MKYLHEDKGLFEAMIVEASSCFQIVPTIIEKDYYVTFFLREILRYQPNIIFKGGTSLSKCYHLINRFSEDIDISLETTNHPTEGQRRALTENIKKVISSNGFILKNPEAIRSRRDYNKFEISVNSIFSTSCLKNDLIVETSTFIRSYPTVEMPASSLLFDYLNSITRNDLISEYELSPFSLHVQTLERTFIDKIFAICDYYIDEKTASHSRHLYDLYKLKKSVSINKELKKLFEIVKKERRKHVACSSAQEGIDVRQCLQEIIMKDVYKNDYENVTAFLIFDNVSYDDARNNLQEIANSSLFIS